MSIILDALRKLDRERSSSPDGPPNIDIEILRPDPPPRGKRIPLYFATVLLTAIATIAVTYAVVVWYGLPLKSRPPASVSSPAPKQQVQPSPPEASSASKSRPPASVSSPAPKQQVQPSPPKASSTPKSGPPASVSSPAPKQQIEPVPSEASSTSKLSHPASLNSSAPSQEVIATPPSHEPVRASGEETSQESPKIQNPPENTDPVTFLGEKKEEQNVVAEKANTVLGNKGKGVEPIPSGSATTPPSLRITVIGWDEDPSKRFAFINGMMVHEGDIIEEAKIVEINPKRIRFLQNGQYFEIPM